MDLTKENLLKILCIGDLHYKISNIQELKIVTDQILEYTKNNKPDYIVCLGDSIDKYILHITPFCELTNFFLELSKITTTIILIGNHDRVNNSDFLSSIHPFNSFKEWENIIVVDSVKYIKLTEINRELVFVPYVPPGRFFDALNTVKDKLINPLCVFAHQELYGCKYNNIISTKGDRWNISNCLLISGHIHDYNKVQDNLIYIGTPLQHAFNETLDKSISLITFNIEKNNFMEERIYFKIPKKINIRCDIKFLEIISNNITENKIFNPETNSIIEYNYLDKIKLTLFGYDEDIKNSLKTTFYKNINKYIKVIDTKIISKEKSTIKIDINKVFLELITDKLKYKNIQLLHYFNRIIDKNNLI